MKISAKKTVVKAQDKIKKSGRDVLFLILVLIILTIGLVMLFSASYPYAYHNEGDSFYYIKRQLVFAAMGITAMVFVAVAIDYKILKKLAFLIYGGTLVLLLIALIMPAQKGDFHRWINLGFISFQPSEIAKFAIVVVFAYLIDINYHRMGTFRYGILPFAILLGIMAGLVVVEPHLSGTVLIVGIGAIMMLIGGAKLRWFLLAGGTVISLGVAAIFALDKLEYATARINGWFDPFSDVQNTTWQTVQSLYAIGSGGVIGLGPGNSRQKYLYVPEPQNDFIFSIVCEELGFVGAVIIILVFALLIWRGFVIAANCPDRFGSMLAMGLIVQVGLQVILNIAVVTNTLPNTGISLPFFSYGGTSLLMLMAQMGVILSVSRYTVTKKD
ncbi:MAG: putative lipid II flippase FtsW [Oscillospiraceae bacterium]|nr:putative lipid II flippase FtsW [Oscillospiraceae bacterium]